MGRKGRRFESCISDQFKCPVSSVVEHRPYKARVEGSNPSPGTIFTIKGNKDIAFIVLLLYNKYYETRVWWNGIHMGLKIPRPRGLASSSLATRTNLNSLGRVSRGRPSGSGLENRRSRNGCRGSSPLSSSNTK